MIQTISPQHINTAGSNMRGSLAVNNSHGGLQSSKSGMLQLAEDQQSEGTDHRRGVSETEFLLNQIRSNINTLKAYQPYQGPPPAHSSLSESDPSPYAYQQEIYTKASKYGQGGLQKITEVSEPQQPGGTAGASEDRQNKGRYV